MLGAAFPFIAGPASMDASAIFPTPTPQSRKKWRRVTPRQCSRTIRCSIGSTGLLLHDRFIEIEKGAGQQRPSRSLHEIPFLIPHDLLRINLAANGPI